MEINGPIDRLLQQAADFVPRLLVALVIFFLAWIVSGFAARWTRRAAQVKIDDQETLQLLSQLARWAVVILGTLVALDQVDFDVTGFVAGLGIAGITIGFALQDIARNFVAGIILLVRQPFDLGDLIEVAGYAGRVLEVTTRDTVIKTWDGEMVIIPNIDVFTKAITNYSKLPLRRRTIRIGLGYGEDAERAAQIFVGALQKVDGVQGDPAPTVLAEALGDSALGLVARFWVNQQSHGLFDVHSAAVRAIKQVAEQEGIDLPYPVQTVRLEGVLPFGVPPGQRGEAAG